MKRLIPALILLLLLPYFGPLADPGCPVHGRGCVHGSSCPAAQKQAVQKGAICHAGEGAGEREEVKKFRCSISSCHGEQASLSGPDMPFIVSQPSFFGAPSASGLLSFEPQNKVDTSLVVLLEPPEGLSIS